MKVVKTYSHCTMYDLPLARQKQHEAQHDPLTCFCIVLRIGASHTDVRDKTGLCKRSGVINVASDVSKDHEHHGGLTTPYIFAVPTSANMNDTIICDVTQYSLVELHRRFRRTYYLHLQGRRKSRASKQATNTPLA
jgi:hypothetical protein